MVPIPHLPKLEAARFVAQVRDICESSPTTPSDYSNLSGRVNSLLRYQVFIDAFLDNDLLLNSFHLLHNFVTGIPNPPSSICMLQLCLNTWHNHLDYFANVRRTRPAIKKPFLPTLVSIPESDEDDEECPGEPLTNGIPFAAPTTSSPPAVSISAEEIDSQFSASPSPEASASVLEHFSDTEEVSVFDDSDSEDDGTEAGVCASVRSASYDPETFVPNIPFPFRETPPSPSSFPESALRSTISVESLLNPRPAPPVPRAILAPIALPTVSVFASTAMCGSSSSLPLSLREHLSPSPLTVAVPTNTAATPAPSRGSASSPPAHITRGIVAVPVGSIGRPSLFARRAGTTPRIALSVTTKDPRILSTSEVADQPIVNTLDNEPMVSYQAVPAPSGAVPSRVGIPPPPHLPLAPLSTPPPAHVPFPFATCLASVPISQTMAGRKRTQSDLSPLPQSAAQRPRLALLEAPRRLDVTNPAPVRPSTSTIDWSSLLPSKEEICEGLGYYDEQIRRLWTDRGFLAWQFGKLTGQRHVPFGHFANYSSSVPSPAVSAADPSDV